MSACECGCGLPAPIARRSKASRGHVKGQPVRFIAGHTWGQPRPVLERFFDSLVALDAAQGDCWVWLGLQNSKGYGRMSIRGRRIAAHRVAYELLVGPIPEGLQIDHLCRNHSCVNPEHLEPVTCRENLRRGINHWNPTHCPHGHEFDDANTYVNPQGSRECRTCRRKQYAAFMASRGGRSNYRPSVHISDAEVPRAQAHRQP